MKRILIAALLALTSTANAQDFKLKGIDLRLIPQSSTPDNCGTLLYCIYVRNSDKHLLYNNSGSITDLSTGGGGGGSGTVTSVGMTVPSWLTVSGSPVTTSGTLAVTATSGQTQNQVLATPDGSSGAVSLRALVAADIPAIAESGVTNLVSDLAAKVPTSRTVSTTSPLGGGGALSGNLTLTCSTCVTTSRQVSAGAGLSGGGDLSADRTISLDLAHVNDFTKDQGTHGFALTDAATITVDCSNGNVLKVTLAGNRTLGAPSNCIDGHTYQFRVKQDGSGSRTLAYNSAYKFPGGAAPTLTTTASAKDYVTCVYDGDSSTMDCVFQGDFH